MAHATDIVGYTYQADNYCPKHIVGQVTSNPGDVNHESGDYDNAEQHLEVVARIRHIDRMDERSFDSDDFPKVIFRDMVISPEDEDEDANITADRCATCHELLENF